MAGIWLLRRPPVAGLVPRSGTKRVARSAFRAKRRVARLIYAFGIHMA